MTQDIIFSKKFSLRNLYLYHYLPLKNVLLTVTLKVTMGVVEIYLLGPIRVLK